MITNIRNLGIVESADELFGHRNYTWRWQVETDNPKETPDTIVGDPRFIQKGWPLISPDFSDPRAVLVNQRVTKDSTDPRITFYTQQFSTNIKFPSGDAGSSSGAGSGGNGVTPATWPLNPLFQPPSIRGYYIREMEPIEEDLRPEDRGGPQSIVNTLGEPLVPPIELARKLPAIAIGINKATIDERFLLDMQDAINDGPWRTLSTGTVKAECEWHSEYDAQYGPYWHLDWVFVYNRRGWTPTRFINAGFHTKEYDSVTNRYRAAPIRDKYGQPVTTPQRLAADGTLIPPPITKTMNMTAGSNVLTAADTQGVVVGDRAQGVGVPSGTTVTALNPGVSVTLSANATAANAAAFVTFTRPEHWLEFWLYHRMPFGTTPF